MDKLNQLHRDWRIIALSGFRQRLEKNMPDGYKIDKFPSSFPAGLTLRRQVSEDVYNTRI